MSFSTNRPTPKQSFWEAAITYTTVGVLVAMVVGAVIGVSIGAQYVCVNYYAPWLLGTTDKQAIAFYCKPNGSAK